MKVNSHSEKHGFTKVIICSPTRDMLLQAISEGLRPAGMENGEFLYLLPSLSYIIKNTGLEPPGYQKSAGTGLVGRPA
jgi:hypothetical protein